MAKDLKETMASEMVSAQDTKENQEDKSLSFKPVRVLDILSLQCFHWMKK